MFLNNNASGYTELVVAGVNFRKTVLEIRNKFALTTENIRHIYEDPLRHGPNDFFIISTCNRTEIYSINSEPKELIDLFSHYRKMDKEEVHRSAYIKSGDEAILHLFRVASGLDSQILGDHEIIAQLKHAFVLAKTHRCASGLMEKLVNASVQASRQVRSRTSISDGTTSISYAVIQMLKQECANQDALNICLMGLGKIGTLTLKNLRNYLPWHKITLLNRNVSKAISVANEYETTFAKPECQNETLKNSAVLIVATGADHPLITKQEIEFSGIKLIFDLSVPSNISADVKELQGLKIYDIDGLSQIVNRTISARENQIPAAMKIIDAHLRGFKDWESRKELYSANSELGR